MLRGLLLSLKIGWIIGCLSLALAQAISVSAPEAKDVVPGEFVTLMFRLEAPVGTEVEATSESKLGWTLLRQPGVITFKNTVKLVPVTVTMPVSVPAGSMDTITLRLATGERASATITVKEQRGFTLQTPANLVLGEGPLTALIENTGNVKDQGLLELSYGER